MKYIHIAMVLTALTVPFAGVGATFETLVSSPYPTSLVCVWPREDEMFYSVILPVAALIVTGLSLLVIISMELIKVNAWSTRACAICTIHSLT